MNTCFVGVDYIVDIMHPSGKIARSAAHAAERQIVSKANRALAHARASGWLGVLVKVGFRPGYHEAPSGSPLFGKAQAYGALAQGQPGTAFHPDLQSELADVVIDKPRVSAFYGTALEPLLRAQRIDRLVVAGVSTAWAVQSLVRDAHDRDYAVVVLEDACAAASEEEHRSSIALLATIARIATVDELPGLG